MSWETSVSRGTLVSRWYELTREILPAMAETQRWPIRYDHCFMRVCLDNAFGAPWRDHVRSPAIHHITDAQLAAAIDVAESIVENPAALLELNSRSLAWRTHGKS